MANAYNVQQQQRGGPPPSSPEGFMEKFRLYETRSKFYMVGRDKGRTFWKILIIDRSEPSELNIREDSAVYTERECSDLLRRIHEGNRVTGGLRFVTACYGIVGFIKFLGPYYMLLITRRRQIGAICGHNVYAIAKNEIIPLPNSPVNYSMVNYQKENRYKKLLGMVDLTKDFYFSYSYHVMWSLQKNMCDNEKGLLVYETMFVWNEYLTRGIRNILQNTLWTVALVYGFFKQATLSISGKDLNLTLIARRSRHYAGTRYLKRGVNEEGSVANDVETEQILIEDVPERLPMQVSSVVQIRGSIPLFWSQETSRLNLKPDIILSKRDRTYEATRLHFENLVQRYGNPIIILNLIKTNEKKPRESILRSEFANAIEFLNKDLPEENRLKFLHWDLNKHSRSKATDVLLLLGKVAAYALTLTGFFYSQVIPDMVSEGQLSLVNCISHGTPTSPCLHLDNQKQNHGDNEDSENPDRNSSGGDTIRPPMVQNGVLRTNCIDCLDRTNVAQYAYGLAALGSQLRALGVLTSTRMDLDDPLAEELMGFYEKMGDTLAHQYGGSAAHNKIFSKRRGKWNAATQSQEFLRTLQRYYSNAYMDAEKQNAINVFLGHFEPQLGKLDVWELDSDQHHIVAGNDQSFDANERYMYVTRVINIFPEAKQRLGVPEWEAIGEDPNCWFPFKRSWSEGNILRGTYLADESNGGSKMHYESTPEIQISTPASETPSSSYASPMPARELFAELRRDRCFKSENADAVDWSNFVDIDWLSSSGNSFEEELFESSTRTASPAATLSSENVVSDEKTPSTSEYGPSSRGRDHIGSDTSMSINEARNGEVVLDEYSASFMQWVTNGEALCL